MVPPRIGDERGFCSKAWNLRVLLEYGIDAVFAQDVAVSSRRGPPTFGRHFGTLLSAENRCQVRIAPDFARGCCPIGDDAEVLYKVTDNDSRAHERGIAWNDPQLAIAWLAAADAVIVSNRATALPCLGKWPDLFERGQ